MTEEAREEDRRRVSEQTRDRHDVIGRFISLDGLPHAQGDRNNESKDGGQERQEDGARQAGGQQVVHRLVVLVGVAEVAVRNFGDVDFVLLEDGLVVTVFVVESCELFLGRILTECSAGCAARLRLPKAHRG